MSLPNSNLKAWELLDQALFTSSHVKAKDKESGETDWENVYPTSKEETETMRKLLNEAIEVADDRSDQDFNSRYNELNDIVTYSETRHRTWKFTLIIGALIGAGILWYFSNSDKEEAEKNKSAVAMVENWKERDTTVTYAKLTEAEVERAHTYYYMNRLKSPVTYKLYKLSSAKSNAEYCKREIKMREHMADTTKSDATRKNALAIKKDKEKALKKYLADYEAYNAMTYADIRKEALKDAKYGVDRANSASRNKMMWTIYLIVLVPLYIFTGYQMGYNISRHRRQRGFMGWIQRVGFAIAAALFGAGLAMKLLPDHMVEYIYANGTRRTDRQTDPTNVVVVAMKVGLMVLGLLIYCFVSAFIMTVETAQGLMDKFKASKQIVK